MNTNIRSAVSRRHGGRRKGQKGQALVIFGLMFIFLIGIAGLATDGAVAYAYSVSLERAASAAALAGAPYMPNYLATATTRAKDESKRNGWVDLAGSTTVTVAAANSRQLDVKVSTIVPTFFMAALGVPPFRITREAIAGYLPPIPLGQPGNQLGSTGAQLGAGNNFYLLRFKAQNKMRSEGDPYTTSGFEGASGNCSGCASNASGTPSNDIHTISNTQGSENSTLDCTTGSAGWKLPCKGGQNFRVTIPPGATGEIQVYNAAFAPDFTRNNTCDNLKGLPNTNNGQTTCGSYSLREGTDDGFNGSDPAYASPPFAVKGNEPLTAANCGNTLPTSTDCNSGAGGGGTNRERRRLYNAVAYTVLAVPNVFLRSDDQPISQTRVLPINAENWDGNHGGTGPGSNATPSYVNVNDGRGLDITQQYGATYAAGLCGVCPKNMKVYHSWDNILIEDGTTNGDNRDSAGQNIVTQVTNGANYGTYVSGTGAAGGILKEGTYRLRVDSLNSNGQCCATAAEGDASKAFALRVVMPGTAPNQPSSGNECVGTGGIKCEVAGWEDMTVYSPIAGAGGTIPLFNLPKEYQGQTIIVDAYDVGDAGGNVDLALIDPKTNAVGTCGSGSVDLPAALALAAPTPPNSCQQYTGSPAAAATLNVFNQGHDRFSATPIQHWGPQFNSGQAPGSPDNRITHAPTYTQTQAGERATSGNGGNFNGSWIRFEIPISTSYDGNCPSSPTGGCFWQLQYTLTAGANDTFSFAVSTKGGPLHLVTS
ncbi:MAG: hypothetical protein QOK05_2824 [Chloroflexota bacterium]|jgi:hypothetical protein|nr:hypothetical protein [Chloroflexota bacterium]